MAQGICSVDACAAPSRTSGMCRPHARRVSLYGDPAGRPARFRSGCDVDGCEGRHRSHGLCAAHLQRWQAHGDLDLSLNRGPAAPCAVDGCDTPSRIGTLCNSHGKRMQRHGDPLAGLPTPSRAPLIDRVLARSVVDAATGCRVWTGGTGSHGYGTVSSQLVHRVAYESLVGPIPEGLTIDHLCRNRLCVNPAHLEPVTRAENSRRQAAALAGALAEANWYEED